MNQRELIEAVETSLQALDQVYKDAATESDLYEAALFTLAVEAARNAGGVVLITSDGVNSSSQLIFRRSPGNLWSGEFTYALINFSMKALEIHLGVYVAGSSRVHHECDLAVMDGEEARRSRIGQVQPRRQGLIAAIEAKHYQISPGIGIGRGFLGLAAELGGRQCSLAFPARSSSSLASLIAPRASECFDEVEPGSSASQRLSAHLEQQIRNWLA